ncbi:MAG: transposase [Kiritimatiellia bacterium]|jgi:REP element-mobilizing transposase RayT|nr:transposase [Kiritimatiellia bacterium]MDP6630477.1 transposase [Kiritimatiellia bacterium]MDP6809934.1 transposase [Kiritimatiellia bacterium]MDP7025024.1 transposase [Kiritimatiellia bacterium]
MPQSLSRAALHLTFSTQDRRKTFVMQEMRDATAAYITGVLKNRGCPVMRIAVASEHIHILFLLSRTETIADTVAAAKRESSGWIVKQEWARMNPSFAQFHWQKGYAIFSVSSSKIDDVSTYIENQMEHHKRVTFQDEYRAFLKRHEVDFDEKYVWE